MKLHTKFTCVMKPENEVDRMNNSCYTYERVYLNDIIIKEPIYITVTPEYCKYCEYDGGHKSLVDKKYEIFPNIMSTCCIRCTKELEEYEKERNIDEHYSDWNVNLCDTCESYGHMCKICRKF